MPGVESYSHRDRRAHRELDRMLGGVGAGVAALTALALYLPPPLLGGLAVGGLVALGGAYLLWAERFLTEYERDLKSGMEPEGRPAFLRAEVTSSVGLEAPPRTPPSPHSRPRRPPSSGGPSA